MSGARTEKACLDDAAREHDETWTLDRQIAQARREMGEARWAQLMKEWDDEPLARRIRRHFAGLPRAGRGVAGDAELGDL